MDEGMTAEHLAAIKARHAAATPGPWCPVPTKDGFGNRLYHVLSGHETTLGAIISSGSYGEGGGIHAKRDADFICQAHQDIPALLAYIDYLESCLRGAPIDPLEIGP